MFTAHDAGHRGITHNFIADTLIGMFIADFCCGLSIGWWKSSHNVHHLVTNHPVSLLPLAASLDLKHELLHYTYGSHDQLPLPLRLLHSENPLEFSLQSFIKLRLYANSYLQSSKGFIHQHLSPSQPSHHTNHC